MSGNKKSLTNQSAAPDSAPNGAPSGLILLVGVMHGEAFLKLSIDQYFEIVSKL